MNIISLINDEDWKMCNQPVVLNIEQLNMEWFMVLFIIKMYHHIGLLFTKVKYKLCYGKKIVWGKDIYLRSNFKLIIEGLNYGRYCVF